MRLNKALIKLVFAISVIIGLPVVLITELLLLMVWVIYSSVVYFNNNISNYLSQNRDEYDLRFIKFNEFIVVLRVKRYT
ncbi:hypothetical protein [Leuconostoc mesenteroides]|uniref:hypothetical protein n=1 Tax=Leuconostoc mesenteroides TaxID=1245 RepID=UPI0023616F68|nr:hypothetical protein [Leuconostoc mesenteroides]